MKRIITLLSTMLLATTIIFAQQQKISVPADMMYQAYKPHLTTKAPSNLVHKNSINYSRSAGINDTLELDYATYDETVSLSVNRNWNGLGSATPTGFMNSFIDSNHVGDNAFIAGIFDSIVYTTTSNSVGYIPLGGSTITIDSLGLLMQLIGPLTNMLHDSIILSIYRINGSNTTLDTNIVFGDTTALSIFEPSTQYIPFNTIPIGIQLAEGEGFAVGITYLNKVDTSYLAFFYGYSDSCGTPTVTIGQSTGTIVTAYPSVLGAITDYDITLSSGGTSYTSTETDNLDFGYFSLETAPNYLPANCAYYAIQDLVMYPIITVSTPYSAAIAADNTISCPNGSVNLTASVFGTNTSSNDLGYNWSSSSNGILAQNGTSTNQLTMGPSGNVTVTLTVTDNDNNSATTVATIVITNAAPTIAIDNLDNFSISCNSSSTLVAHTSGSTLSQAGLTYLWSDGGTNSSITINSQDGLPRPYDYAGTYTLTVTNVYTCSSTASATVTYSNGVTNNVSFTVPSPVIASTYTTFINTSTSYEVPWVATMDPDYTGQNLTTVSNGSPDITIVYTAPGNTTATLIMDSAGCRFATAQTFLVKPLPQGINNLTFDDNISLTPNPSNGLVKMQVSGIEKGISIQVYNVIGQQLKSYASTDVSGTYTNNFDFSDLPSGAYMVKIQSGTQIAIKKMLITR